jgi:carboxypeptidase Q
MGLLFLLALVGAVGAVTLPSSFAGQVARILALANNSTSGFDRLSSWVDLVGPRISGSAALEHALDVALQEMEHEGFQNVHAEAATVPRWVRGSESLTLLQPYVKSLGLLGLGSSIGGDVTGEVLVVRTFDELDSRAAGKIVLFNYVCDWARSADACYGQMVTYRVDGASHAAKFGALASLTRSLTGRSLYTPHTGDMNYAAGVPQIPTACITTEDADLFQRLQDRKVPIRVRLQMAAQNFPPVASRNIIAELKGSEFPEQVVMLGGHTDSWDVGQGAEDDAAGFMLAWEAMSLIQRAGIVPRRTLRLIGWVCEEFGGIGAQQYFAAHQAEATNMSLVLESDLGVFQPFGLHFTQSNPAAVAIMTQIMSYAAPLNSSRVVGGGGDEDSGPWIQAGVPGASPYNDPSTYFDEHHTNADMMSHVPVQYYEQSAATIAIAVLGAAQLDGLIPRTG